MNKPMAVCLSCGGPAPVPIFTEGRGPYCQRCHHDVPAKRKSPWRYPTAFSDWGPNEYSAIHRVVESGQFTMGPEVAAFEREFADYHGMAHGVMVNSGSSANLIMIAALATMGLIKAGQQVLVPALAWSTTYAPLVQYGLDLVLADCDTTWNADLDAGGDWDKVKLVVGCSVLGNPADLLGWKSAAGVLGAVFVEDNCESLGARIADGRQTGTLGLMNTFSFFYSHQVSAIEGGMILTDDDQCAAACRMLRAHGWTRDIKKPMTFADEYDFQSFGYNVRPLDMHAAIAREQLKRLAEFVEKRQNNDATWNDLVDEVDTLSQVPINRPLKQGLMQSPFGLQFMVDPNKRDALVAALRAASIDCRLPTGGSFRMHGYGKPWADQETPMADQIHQCGLFLGNGPLDLSEEITQAVGIIKGVLQ